jgi:hypothetical protein
MTGNNARTVVSSGIARPIIMSLAVAASLFVVFVLPAEYDVDPTGLGALMGIKGMSSYSELKRIANPIASSVAGESDTPASRYHVPIDPPLQFVTVAIELVPFGQAEYKFTMEEGDSLSYSWATDQGEAYADLHGHTMVDGSEVLVEYLKSDSVSGGSGRITTPFAGEHGWYFLNLEEQKQIVTLKVSGTFSAQELIDLGSQLP